MREIKFKGMSINGSWYYGNLSILKQKVSPAEAGSYISNSVGITFAYSVRPETVGQYTGLHDKNGKEIYEGDIAKVTERRHDGLDYTELGVMEFNQKEAFFGFKCEDSLLSDGIPILVLKREVEVIGNIHENPELVKP